MYQQEKNSLISLRQHSLISLSQNVVEALNHLSNHIGIMDPALSGGGVLYYVVKIVDGMHSPVQDSTKCGLLGGLAITVQYLPDCILTIFYFHGKMRLIG